MRLFLLFLFLVLISSTKSQSQNLRPKVYFLTDSIEIGRPFRLALSLNHNFKTEVFFPDTTYKFSPFEVLKYEYFDTKTTNGISLDSAVYTLIPFDLASKQQISLPIWAIIKQDCTAFFSETKTIPLKLTLSETARDTAQLKIDTNIKPLKQQINFPLILLVSVLTLLFGTGVYLIFGSQIQRQWRVYQLFLRNQEFKRALTRLSKNRKKTNEIQSVEEALILWKKYMQRLEKKPFMTFTTKEIIDNLPNESLDAALQRIDAMIYGGMASTKTEELMAILKEIARENYRKQITLVKQRQ